MKKRLSALFFLGLAISQIGVSQEKFFAQFPAGSTPQEVGQRVAKRYTESRHGFWGNSKNIGYHEVCTWNGALMFANATHDEHLQQQLRARLDRLINEEQEHLPGKNHVDLNMFGSLPLMMYVTFGEEAYRTLGLSYADSQWQLPADAKESRRRLARQGYTWQTRMWIDDMYMITIVQAWAYRATGDRKYIDRAAHEMVKYLDEMQRPNGLFFHAPDVPYFWARGNGWMAAGMTEVLKVLPTDSPYYKRILKGYRRMMKSLLRHRNAQGIWNQLIDQPDFWAETSGTGMFTYAFISGVRHGWLSEKTYGPAARQAWLELVKYINDDGDVREVCIGTNKLNDFNYYLDRPRTTGDFHGQAPVLWCAAALLEAVSTATKE